MQNGLGLLNDRPRGLADHVTWCEAEQNCASIHSPSTNVTSITESQDGAPTKSETRIEDARVAAIFRPKVRAKAARPVTTPGH